MVVKIYLYDDSGNKINASFKWVRGLFSPSRVEIITKSSALNLGDIIYLKDDSGNTLFKGRIVNKSEKNRGVGQYVAMSEFHRMIEDYRAVTFFNKTNMEIVESLIDLYNYSDRTVVGFDNSGGCSAVNVSYFAQRGHTLSEIYYLLYMSDCYFTDYYDSVNDIWKLKPIQINDTGKTYYEGAKQNTDGIIVYIRDLKREKGNIVNKVIVRGKNDIKTSEEHGNVESGSGDYNGYGYIKTNHKIYGDLKLYIDGEEYNDAMVLNERGVVLVSSSLVGKEYEIQYSWDDTPYVMVKDDSSISKYGERMKTYTIDTKDYNALLDYANSILNMYKEPPLQAVVELINDEWNIGDKIYLRLYNPDNNTYDDAIEVIIFEKIYSAGRYQYRIGNIGTIMGIMKNVLENLKIELSLVNISTTNKLTDNEMNIEVDWKGNLIGMKKGKAARIYQNIQDGNTSVSRRFGNIEVILMKGKYAYSGEENNYYIYSGSGSTFKINKSSTSSNVNAELIFGGRFGKYDVNLHYVSGGDYLFINGYSASVCSKFKVDNLWTAYGTGIKYSIIFRDSLDLANDGDTQNMISVKVGSEDAKFLFYAKNESGTINVYLKKTSNGEERKLYTVSDYDENEIRFILYFLSNEIAGGSGGKVRIYAKDSNSDIFYFEDDISVANGVDVFIYYLGSGYCKGHLMIGESSDITYAGSDYNSNEFDVMVIKEVI